MTQVITQEVIEAVKAAIMAAKETENPVNASRSVKIMSRTVGPAPKQPLFN